MKTTYFIRSPLSVLLICFFGMQNISVAQPYTYTYTASLHSKFVHYDRVFSNKKNNRTQTGFGFQLKYRKPLLNNRLQLNLAAYSATNLLSSGKKTEDVFALNKRHFNLLGEANIIYKPNKNIDFRIGRSEHHSMLLKSKTRALPSTFEGVNFLYKTKEIKLYAHQFYKWSRRANSDFNPFEVEFIDGTRKKIDAILILGAQVNLFNQKLTLTSEYLNSKNYLHKWGVVGQYKHTFNEKKRMTSELGYFISQDTGKLFSAASVGVLDSYTTNASLNRLNHQGQGFYWQGKYHHHNHTLHFGFSRFRQPWIEDNFADDHGMTPFPSKTIGPDLSNKNEHVWFGGYRHNWKTSNLKGLSLSLDAAFANNIENSIDKRLGSAKEKWGDINLRYRPPKLQGLFIRVRYRNYKSNKMGDVAGVTSDRHETRAEIHYKIPF